VKAAPAHPVVKAFPARLPPEGGLEADDGRPVFAEEVLRPAEESASFVVARVEGDGLQELLASALVVAGVVQRLALNECGLGADAPAQVVDELLSGNWRQSESDDDHEDAEQRQCGEPRPRTHGGG